MATEKFILQQPAEDDPTGFTVIGELRDGIYEVCTVPLPAHLCGIRGGGPHYGPGEQDVAKAALEWLRTPEKKREHLTKDEQIAELRAQLADARGDG